MNRNAWTVEARPWMSMWGLAEMIRNEFLRGKRPGRLVRWKHLVTPSLLASIAECKICELLCTAQGRAGVSTQWCKYLQTDHVELDHPVC